MCFMCAIVNFFFLNRISALDPMLKLVSEMIEIILFYIPERERPIARHDNGSHPLSDHAVETVRTAVSERS